MMQAAAEVQADTPVDSDPEVSAASANPEVVIAIKN